MAFFESDGYDITSDDDKRDAMARVEAHNAIQAAVAPKVAAFERRGSECTRTICTLMQQKARAAVRAPLTVTV